MKISRNVVYTRDFVEEAARRKGTYGRTDLFKTGYAELDRYLGGGYGREQGYEIIVLFGSTGIGKSTVGLNLIATPIKEGKKVGLLILEDDMPDVMNRLEQVLGEDEYAKMTQGDTVICLPVEALDKPWSLDDLLEYVEHWFTDLNIDLIFFDHLQMAFEGAEAIKGENEYISQRVFMQKLNRLMKKVNKTVIIVSHVNKAANAKGMDRIVGSSSIAQAATKVIEVSKDDLDDALRVTLRKSRFTSTPDFHYTVKLIKGKIEQAY